MVKGAAAEEIQISCVQMILIEELFAGVKVLPIVSQARVRFFIELGKAMKFHEAKAGAATLVFNQGANRDDETRRPNRDGLFDNRQVQDETGDKSETDQSLCVPGRGE